MEHIEQQARQPPYGSPHHHGFWTPGSPSAGPKGPSQGPPPASDGRRDDEQHSADSAETSAAATDTASSGRTADLRNENVTVFGNQRQLLPTQPYGPDITKPAQYPYAHHNAQPIGPVDYGQWQPRYVPGAGAMYGAGHTAQAPWPPFTANQPTQLNPTSYGFNPQVYAPMGGYAPPELDQSTTAATGTSMDRGRNTLFETQGAAAPDRHLHQTTEQYLGPQREENVKERAKALENLLARAPKPKRQRRDSEPRTSPRAPSVPPEEGLLEKNRQAKRKSTERARAQVRQTGRRGGLKPR